MVPSFDNREAADAALTDGYSVSACIIKDGRPRYFLVPSDTPESEMRRIAFEVARGRAMSSFEDSLLTIAEQSRGS